MFRTVIVPLDGSPHAEIAIPYAENEALRHGASLVLTRIITRPEPSVSPVQHGGPAPKAMQWPEAEVAREKHAANQYLEAVRDRYQLGSQTTLSISVGDPTTRLLAEANRHTYPLVVMTTGDATDGSRPPLSEVARRLMVAGTVPILGVRSPPAPAAGPKASLNGATPHTLHA